MKNCIVPHWPSPGRPKQGQVERLAWYQAKVAEAISQKTYLVCKARRQVMFYCRYCRPAARPCTFDRTQHQLIAGLTPLRVEDRQIRDILHTLVINGGVQPICASRRFGIDMDHEGGDSGSANRPVIGCEGAAIELAATLAVHSK